MSTELVAKSIIRKLWLTERDKFRDHLLRLDEEGRRLRFAHGVADGFIDDYAQRLSDLGGLVFGAFVDSEVRAVAELRKLGDTWGREAEAALSVERQYQDQGLGTELTGRVIRAARNRNVRLLYMSCLAENAKMQAIARRFDAEMRVEYDEVIGEIVPATSDYFSLMAEAVDDRVGFMMTVFDLSARMVKAA